MGQWQVCTEHWNRAREDLPESKLIAFSLEAMQRLLDIGKIGRNPPASVVACPICAHGEDKTDLVYLRIVKEVKRT